MRLKPYTSVVEQNDRLMLLYLLVGLIIATTLAIVVGILVTFGISLVIAILYFSGLAYLIVRNKRSNALMLKRIHFNLALILRNENDELFSRYSIKARPGFLSKWIEFHWANPYGMMIP